MTGNLILDWVMMALSLFNTIVITWMGLTVLLNAERRTWGVWLTGSGMLAGALFFVSHSILLGLDLQDVSPGMDFWWRAGWPLVVMLPFAWYVVILWYTGYWDATRVRSPLRRRQQAWLAGTGILLALLVGILVFANPLPSYLQATHLASGDTASLHNAPLLFVLYALYNILCIVLSLDALLNPAPSGRMMGDLARRRARPWLIAASLSFLLVSLLLAVAMLWVVFSVPGGNETLAFVIGGFDITISACIASAVLLIGRALVSYEVFTGKTLPRRGFYRLWRNTVILAGGFGIVAGGSFALHVQAIYILLLSTCIVAVFHALSSWRSYAEREKYMQQLRPFIASQGLYEQLLAPEGASAGDFDVAASFQALCADVLAVHLAYLIPVGSMAPFAGPGLAYPPGNRIPSVMLNDVAERARHEPASTTCLAVDRTDYGGASWAVPLWSQRGLMGVLLLGDKPDGGLYTQEEIEIAQTSAERLLDGMAGAEMARRLMALQRQRLSENQLLDQRARRVLHDDVLPLLHAAMLNLSAQDRAAGDTPVEATSVVAQLADVHHQISNLLHEIAATAGTEVAKVGLVTGLRRVMDLELADEFTTVTWDVDLGAERELRALPGLMAEVLFYAAREAIRNSARYGRGDDPNRALHLHVRVACDEALAIVIEDDGAGLRRDSLRDESPPALNGPAPDGGSGQGLALHSTMMAVIGGSLAVESQPGAFTRVTLSLPGGAWHA